MKLRFALPALAAIAMLASGCAQQRGPANKALESVEDSLKNVRDDAEKYAPEGLKSVDAQLKNLKQSFDEKHYDNVLAGAPSLQKAVDSLAAAVNSGKEQRRSAVAAAKTEWEGLNVEVPKLVDAIQARVDELTKKKHLPFGVSKDEFEGAKAGLESIKTAWADAKSEFSKGDAVEASAKARTVKGMAIEVKEKLKIKDA
jgi:ASC-1-like (ASCH) protein